MDKIYLPIVIIIALLVLYFIYRRKSNKIKINNKNENRIKSNYETKVEEETERDFEAEAENEIYEVSEEMLPYKKKYLLTKNEWYFYKGLKPIADELGYTILAKIRVADLIEVTTKDPKEKMAYTNKINRKHIDFALARPENLKIELLIELDDMSHSTKQKDRDEFIEKLYEKAGYKLLRVHGSGDLKEKIENILEIDKKPIEEKNTEITADSEPENKTEKEIKSEK